MTRLSLLGQIAGMVGLILKSLFFMLFHLLRLNSGLSDVLSSQKSAAVKSAVSVETVGLQCRCLSMIEAPRLVHVTEQRTEFSRSHLAICIQFECVHKCFVIDLSHRTKSDVGRIFWNGMAQTPQLAT